jgi:hypothetical protein
VISDVMPESILNCAGHSFDFGNVNFAVLHECEHRRRGLLPAHLDAALVDIARAKLAQVHDSYVEAGGTPSYWEALEREILETTMPQYIEAAREKNRLEKSNYDLWRGGDLVSRAVLALVALTIGGIVVALPFIPIFEDAFAFFLALSAWFYPELKRLMFEHRHAHLLNRLIVEAERYQHDHRIHYVSQAALDEAFRTPALPDRSEVLDVHALDRSRDEEKLPR